MTSLVALQPQKIIVNVIEVLLENMQEKFAKFGTESLDNKE